MLIIYVHSPKYSLSKIKLSKGADFPVMGISHKHAPEGSPFAMELIINSPKYGQFTVLYDEEDHERISKYTWHVSKTSSTYAFYVRNNTAGYLHSFLMGAKWIDHINRNRLDNRKLNLRKATNAENIRNRGMLPNNTSGFKGVFFDKKINLYQVKIVFNGKDIGMKRFQNKYAAALAYNELASKYFGEFAVLNVLTEEEIELSKKAIVRLSKTNTSGFRGVFYNKREGLYKVCLKYNNKKYYGKSGRTAREAAISCNALIKENNLPDSYLNIIPNV